MILWALRNGDAVPFGAHGPLVPAVTGASMNAKITSVVAVTEPAGPTLRNSPPGDS
jgi:hypothetical protein